MPVHLNANLAIIVHVVVDIGVGNYTQVPLLCNILRLVAGICAKQGLYLACCDARSV